MQFFAFDLLADIRLYLCEITVSTSKFKENNNEYNNLKNEQNNVDDNKLEYSDIEDNFSEEEINKKEKKTIGWPNYAGIIAIVGGVAVLIAGNRKNN